MLLGLYRIVLHLHLATNRSKVVILAEWLVEHGRVDPADFLRLMNGECTEQAGKKLRGYWLISLVVSQFEF